MEYMTGPATSSQGNILCCQCGVPVPPNPANMCVACLRTQVDISEGIPKQVSVHFCKQCERYLQPPGTWIQCALESRELLTLCLKKLKASLSKVRLIDAGFIWTEPHSKRLKVKLTIQKEVMNGAILQQVFVVDYVVQAQMCDDCHRVEAKDFWKAVVQVRQKVLHKKTFYYLEQIILKHRLHQNTLRVKEIHDGLDFYYVSKQHAQKMLDFLQCTVPCRSKTSQRLISHDIHSNSYNYKSTFSVEIVPICKDNVVCLSPKLAQSLGNMSQICVCVRVTSAIHLIDPNTLQIAEVDGNTYWRHPFHSLFHPKQLEEFIVMDIDIVKDRKQGAGAGVRSNKHTLAEVWVQKTSEMNTNQQYHCRTHLGHLLNPGDLVQGFDLANCNLNDEFINKMNAHHLPDVVLIKKSYDRSRRQRRRNWKLKELEREREDMDTDDERQYQDFLEDLEEDEVLRKNVNIYKSKGMYSTQDSILISTKARHTHSVAVGLMIVWLCQVCMCILWGESGESCCQKLPVAAYLLSEQKDRVKKFISLAPLPRHGSRELPTHIKLLAYNMGALKGFSQTFFILMTHAQDRSSVSDWWGSDTRDSCACSGAELHLGHVTDKCDVTGISESCLKTTPLLRVPEPSQTADQRATNQIIMTYPEDMVGH